MNKNIQYTNFFMFDVMVFVLIANIIVVSQSVTFKSLIVCANKLNAGLCRCTCWPCSIEMIGISLYYRHEVVISHNIFN